MKDIKEMIKEIVAKTNQSIETMNNPAQNVSLPKSLENSLEESLITKVNQNVVDDKIEIPTIIFAQDEEYLNRCHNYVFEVQAAAYLMKVGLYLYIDKLQIGYDAKTKKITLPLDGVKGSRYFSIRLNFDNAADEEEAQKVLQYYNLKPNETAKWNLYKDADDKLINGGKNYDEPYNELGRKLIEKLQTGDDEKYASDI